MAARVFVSCGQATNEERQVASKVKEWLESKGYDVFVALETQSLNDINAGTIGHLRMADYFLFIDFPREEIVPSDVDSKLERKKRGSVYSHQELAIAYVFGFPESIFLKHQDVELRGIAQFQMANAAEFKDYDELPIIVQTLVEERCWSPLYTRHLRATEIIKPQSPQSYDSLGNIRNDWNFYVKIHNNRTDAVAWHCVGRLTKLWYDGNEQQLHDKNPLSWGGRSGYESLIFPGDSESLSLFGVDQDQNRHIYLHSQRGIPPQNPIINLPGVYRLEYQVVAESFPLYEFEIELTHTKDIKTIQVKLIGNAIPKTSH
ncbi:MAG TPA: hypothetical protein DD473_06855 [Planctomycetaceae bacterium]|nr:hypothetical protein [Planctomycetaceae bacterium]|tara:strand:- start:259 stop:1209 length:951 start_codon:yes stop_codon:yes gene_type:complete